MRYWENPADDYEARRRGGWRNYSITTWLIIINVVIFCLEALLAKFAPNQFRLIFRPLGLTPFDVVHRGFVWQLVTYAFLHDPLDILHVIFNMLGLYWFGGQIEMVWGRRRYLTFYFAAAVFAGICFMVVELFMEDPLSWCVGASGACLALLMIYALWWPNRTVILFIIPMRVWTLVLLIVVIEAFSLIMRSGNVANGAHLGGLLFGYLVIKGGPALDRFLSGLQRARERDTESDQRRVDAILDKVHREGMNSLSWGERRFLQKYSRRQKRR